MCPRSDSGCRESGASSGGARLARLLQGPGEPGGGSGGSVSGLLHCQAWRYCPLLRRPRGPPRSGATCVHGAFPSLTPTCPPAKLGGGAGDEREREVDPAFEGGAVGQGGSWGTRGDQAARCRKRPAHACDPSGSIRFWNAGAESTVLASEAGAPLPARGPASPA